MSFIKNITHVIFTTEKDTRYFHPLRMFLTSF